MNMADSIKICFQKYADFDGRATRSEYWWFFFFCLIVGIISAVYSEVSENPIPELIIQIVLLIPSLAVATRRLHDINKSGWNQLWSITVIGLIPLIVWYCQKSKKGKSRF